MDLWASEAPLSHRSTWRSHGPSLPRELCICLSLPCFITHLFYVIEHLHSLPQHLQPLAATPEVTVSVFSLVLTKFQSLAPALVSRTPLLVDIICCLDEVRACVPGCVQGSHRWRHEAQVNHATQGSLQTPPNQELNGLQTSAVINTSAALKHATWGAPASSGTHSKGFCQKLEGCRGRFPFTYGSEVFLEYLPIFSLAEDAE